MKQFQKQLSTDTKIHKVIKQYLTLQNWIYNPKPVLSISHSFTVALAFSEDPDQIKVFLFSHTLHNCSMTTLVFTCAFTVYCIIKTEILKNVHYLPCCTQVCQPCCTQVCQHNAHKSENTAVHQSVNTMYIFLPCLTYVNV